MRLYIGFITYGKSTAKYLPYFLPSLKRQSFKDFKILVIDNSEEEKNDNSVYIKNNFTPLNKVAGEINQKKIDIADDLESLTGNKYLMGFPEIDLKWPGKNLGYAKAFNLMIKEAAMAGAEYFLALNPDMVFEDDALEKLVDAMDHNSELGSATAKALKWDFASQEKTNIIDSCGLKLLPGLRFVDYMEGEPASASCEQEIIGASGASAIYRLSALEKVKRAEQYFDELMFMYKEDCDLSYRLFLAGYKSKCVHDAIIYHDRSSAGMGEGDLAVVLNRKNKSRQVKQLSFLNQQIIFIKYWRLQNLASKIAIIWFELKMLVFILFFEPYLLKELVNLSKISHKIIRYKNGD